MKFVMSSFKRRIRKNTVVKRRKIRGTRIVCRDLITNFQRAESKIENPLTGKMMKTMNKKDKMGKLSKFLSPSLFNYDFQPAPVSGSQPQSPTPAPVSGSQPHLTLLKGIKQYRNTCFLNSAAMLMKNIPGLRFESEEMRILYETSPENITEDMVRGVVGMCKTMRYGRQEDSMEMAMTMMGNLRNKEKLSITGGIKFYLYRNKQCLPLFSYIDDSHKTRTGFGWSSETIRITNIQEKSYGSVQEALDQLGFDGMGTEYNFGDSWDFFSENDYVEENGNLVTLKDIYRETGSWNIPICTKWIYTPESEYLVLDLSTVNIPERRKIEARIEDITQVLNFTSGGYAPVSFVTHIGQLNFGHYINYSLIDGVWYEFNDQKVSRLTDISEYHGIPYYVLYRRF